MDITTKKPRELEAYFRELIRKTLGDKVENTSTVTSSSGGNYQIMIYGDDQGASFNFKKRSANKIAKSIRALK